MWMMYNWGFATRNTRVKNNLQFVIYSLHAHHPTLETQQDVHWGVDVACEHPGPHWTAKNLYPNLPCMTTSPVDTTIRRIV